MAEENMNSDNVKGQEDRGDDPDLAMDGLPSRKKLLEMLAKTQMTDEMKEEMKAMLAGGAPELFGTSGGGTFLGLVFILLIFSIMLFFGYKLYKSIKDKETKREEKKKQRQMKKKK